MDVRSWAGRHALVLYFVLAFAVSWSVWPLVLANPASTPMVPFGPLLSALVVAGVVGGGGAVWALVRQLGRWRVPPVWYAVALGGPMALTGLGTAAVVAAGAPPPDVRVADWGSLAATLVSTMLIVGLFEEVGWRGFAQPRLQLTRSGLKAALALGVVWALWHVPELVSDAGEREPVPFLVSVVAYAVVLAWLYNSTGGSLPIVITCHAAINTTIGAVLRDLPDEHRATGWWILTAVYVVAAAAVVAAAGSRLGSTTRPSRGIGAAEPYVAGATGGGQGQPHAVGTSERTDTS